MDLQEICYFVEIESVTLEKYLLWKIFLYNVEFFHG
jgi:hypothetical protein